MQNLGQFFTLVAFAAAVLLPREAFLSQVHHRYQKHNIEDSIADKAQQIVVVEATGKRKTFKKVVFPKRSHHRRERSSTYVEWVVEYKVVEVFRATSLEAGHSFWALQVPDYNEKSVRLYHERGMSRSPIVRRIEPKYPRGEEQSSIAFVRQLGRESDEFAAVYRITVHEGMTGKKEVSSLLAQP